ncbi:cytosolic phospholipase A2 gamma-like isoform X1 [Lepisosteus oculatus]|uniref:cytosolic phospholipase A2 gamma-like isoform X1 n=1 Tax=Lepisosteus oculatus TaxID=7918 RepID=UPI0035F5011F
MVALMGTLTELGAQNLLDTIMYLCGVSGSTWCLTSLYHNQTWSSELEKAEKEMVQRLTTGSFDCLKALARIMEAEKDENFSITDIFASTVVHDMVKQVDEEHFSKETDDEMNNPYPILAVVDKKQRQKDEYDRGVWCEITRHEVGYSGYGAFVETPFFGSRFAGGNVEEHRDEMDILYLQGLCGSCFADFQYNIEWICNQLLKGNTEETKQKKDMKAIQDSLEKMDLTPDFFKKIFTLILSWTWGTKYNFLYKYPDTAKTLPEYLVNNEKIYLEDAAIANDCGYPLVLRNDRRVKLILSFDFSNEDPFLTVTKAAKYCEKNNIPFPPIPPVTKEEKECPLSCYVYSADKTPTVMHFPLFNKDSCESKEKIAQMKNIYKTFNLSYNENELDDLLNLAKKNVSLNKDKIITEIKKAVGAERKK